MAFVLQLFGGFRLVGEDGSPVSLPERPRALLAYLAVEGTAVPRQVLAELLSAEGTEQDQRTALRQAMYLARRALAPGAVICTRGDDLSIDPALVRTDAVRFQAAIRRGDDRALAEAAELYRGPFLDGERSPSPAYEEWLVARRRDFLEQMLEALLRLADAEAKAGRHRTALARARCALKLDPLREDVHRRVMLSLAAMGQRSDALRHYEITRQMLADELDVAPEQETAALRDAIARGAEPKPAAPTATCDLPLGAAAGQARKSRPTPLNPWRTRLAAMAIVLPMAFGGVLVWLLHPAPRVADGTPSIAIVPFVNGSGDPAQDYLGPGVVEEITTMLSTHPGIRVVSRLKGETADATAQRLGEELGVRYVLEGSVRRSRDSIHLTAQLTDAVTGYHLWARRFDERGRDLFALQEQIANRIYESLVGFTGEIRTEEQRHAWNKPARSLEEQDYVLRGERYYFRFTEEAHTRAREIWQEGLARFPGSARLRLGLAAGYRHGVEAGWSRHPEGDLDRAWQLGQEAALSAGNSRFDRWLTHWLLAKLTQWCKADYERSVAEARAAVELVPYDATSLADLAELMANAGRTDEAIAWLQEALRRDPMGPEWYVANLAWAYYLAGRHEDALRELQKMSRPRYLLMAALHVRLGRMEDARAAVEQFSRGNPGYTLADEARRPLIGPLKSAWLDDLRRSGLPD